MTDRSAHVCALFALSRAGPDRTRASALRAARQAAVALAGLQPGRVGLLIGPSGSGKSTALALLRRRLARQHRPVVGPPTHLPARRPAIDHVGHDLQQALGLLSAAGLAEAAVLPKPAGVLSTGQRARLALACAMDRCPAGGVLVADEFAAVLDRVTARSLAMTLARWCRGQARATLVLACAHDDLIEALRPDLLVVMPLPGESPSPPTILACAPRGVRPWPRAT
ncbi:MAG: hypothetical protein KatS3mg103_1193 [Phycisphaerales bacterium]|nr:MAG: hypothetical protein KatS3mg103_1193 [Phycisphaerales bacterium]